MELWHKGSTGGALLRRQAPAALLIPLAVGLLVLAAERIHDIPDGLLIACFVMLSFLAGGSFAFWSARTLDELEEARLSAVKDLVASEAMFRGLMAGASDAILVIDAQGRITFKNRQVGVLFGYEPHELIGEPLECLIPERFRSSHADYQAAYLQAPRRLGIRRKMDFLARRKDGSEFPADISLSPVETVEGRFVMVLVRDLTEHYEAAEAIAELNAQLQRHNEAIEAEIVARTHELAHQNKLVQSLQQEKIEALERADALKDVFLNVISHELRTPLAVLSGTISLLEYEVDGPLSSAQRQDVARLRESTDHLLALVNDLLDMGMIHAGKLTIVPKPLPVVELIQGAIDFVQPLASERRITIETELAPELPVIAADMQRIRQVLINLMSNALKYSPPESTVSIRVRPDEAGLRCEVADQGAGVPLEQQRRIFEKFTRIDHDAHPDGAGLGLYICHALVSAHRGEIGITSDGETGSTFWFTLPKTR